jgi:hypothetical protein
MDKSLFKSHIFRFRFDYKTQKIHHAQNTEVSTFFVDLFFLFLDINEGPFTTDVTLVVEKSEAGSTDNDEVGEMAEEIMPLSDSILFIRKDFFAKDF